MVKRIKYLLHKARLWTPTTHTDKIDVLLVARPDTYLNNRLIPTVTTDVFTAIRFMENVIAVDYTAEYVVTPANNLNAVRSTYIYRWYSNNNIMLGQQPILTWLRLAKQVYALHVFGLQQDVTSRPYRNSLKLTLLIREIEEIINTLWYTS